MIRWISLLCIFSFSIISLNGQENDIFNVDNSRKFATYLFESGQFDLAADEFERVVFLEPKDSLSILRLLQAYRYENDFKIGLNRAHILLPNQKMLNKEYLKEIFLLQAYDQRNDSNIKLIEENIGLNGEEKHRFMLSAVMLDKDWSKASAYFETNPSKDDYYNSLGGLLSERNELRRKNPYLSASLSAVLPGMGKVYSGDWQDGLITFAFVASNAWQAYRGFKKDGIKSTYGWIFGSIGAGFYLGNVFGSYKSAKDHNKRVEKKYYDQVSGIIYSNL